MLPKTVKQVVQLFFVLLLTNICFCFGKSVYVNQIRVLIPGRHPDNDGRGCRRTGMLIQLITSI